jgi:asparagine synthase (glutamine-hydrolysing)
LVTSIAARYKSSLRTFTVSFKGQYDEAPLAKLVANKYGTNHTEIKISFDSLKFDIETILANYGEPFFDSSAIPSYYVSKEARKHLTVILNGDGSDELFGGYRRYVPFSKFDFFNSNSLIKAGAKVINNFLPDSNNKKTYYNYLTRLIHLASKGRLDLYLSATSDIFEDYLNLLVGNNIKIQEEGIKSVFEKILSSKMTSLQKIMDMDFNFLLFGDFLVKMDIATMANSLEARSPFLSKELLEFAPTIPDSFKITNISTKYILRVLAKKYLPKELINQPKRGFEVPLKKWINNDLKEPVFELISSSNAYHRKYINNELFQKVLNNKVSMPDEKRAKIIWAIYCLDVWYKKHICN